jgi:hypothetical protein
VTIRLCLRSLSAVVQAAAFASVAAAQAAQPPQAAPQVGTRSGTHIEFSGLVLANGFFNNAKVNNSDVPQFVLPPDPPNGLPAGGAGATVRQTQLSLTATVPQFAGGQFTGLVDVDFYGGQEVSSGGRAFALLRVRRMRADIDWDHVWVMFGQDSPPIADVNPSSVASLGFPLFATAGNLWLWIPQVRVGADAGTDVRFGVEAAVLAPSSDEAQTTFLTVPTRAEQSKRPNVEGRIRVRWGGNETPGELSIGGHYGWFAAQGDTLIVSQAVTASTRFLLTQYVEVRGEAFSGKALAGLGGGGIGASFGNGGVPLRTKGGWAQLNILPTPEWELGGGYGMDDPNDDDLLPPSGASPRLKNVSFEGHLTWRPSPLVLGLEFRRITTTYPAAVNDQAVNHLNVALGFAF